MSETAIGNPEPEDNNVYHLNTGTNTSGAISGTWGGTIWQNMYYCYRCSNSYHNYGYSCPTAVVPSTTTVIYRDNPYSKCDYCDGYHGGTCPRIEKIDYYKDGTVKSIKFRAPDED